MAKDNQLSYIDIKKQLNRAHILKLEQQQQQLTRKIEAVKLLVNKNYCRFMYLPTVNMYAINSKIIVWI